MYRLVMAVVCLGYTINLFAADDKLSLNFSKERGFYSTSFLLKLEASDPSAIIKYTTNFTDPFSTSGLIYNAAIEIKTTTVVKAIAYSANDTTNLVTHTFLFPEDIKNQPKRPNGFPDEWGGSSTIDADYEMDPDVIDAPEYSAKIVDALKSIPSLCLSMDTDDWFNPETGLYKGYANSNLTTEKAVSAEFIYADPKESFLVRCGLQNQGGTSIIDWKVPKQSMRLLFKDEYGPKKLKKKIFPDSDIESINTLVVDGFLYSWIHPWDDTQRETTLYFRDQLASNIQNAMGGLSFHGIYVNVYINGLYWGMYDVHERPDQDFLAEYYGADPDDFDVIKHDQDRVVAGSNDSYKELLSVAREGLRSNDDLENIKNYLDLPKFIDYIILNFYLGNFDWAHQNYYAAVNKTEQTGFRFYTWDAEHVMRYSNVEYDNTTKNDRGGPTEIHQLLRQNDEYRLMFADAFYRHTHNNGALTPENFEKAFLKLKDEIDLAVILESARWGDYLQSSTKTVFTRNDHWIPEVERVLDDYIPNRLAIVTEQLQSSKNNLYPRNTPPDFSVAAGTVKKGTEVELFNTNSENGSIVYTLDGTDPREIGGASRGAIYSDPIVINQATLIKARFRRSNINWSPLTERYYVPGDQVDKIAISEIMYNPGSEGVEFIELLNTGTISVDLNGYSFVDGIEYSFPEPVLLPPGKRLALTNDEALFEEFYGFKAYGVFNKSLSNGGETILLANYFGEIIDSVSYSDSDPWPVEADGTGLSLELIDPNNDNSVAYNWRTSATRLGSPEKFVPGNWTTFEDLMNPELNVYPNPFVDELSVEFKNELYTGRVYLVLCNQLGQILLNRTINENEYAVSLDVSGLKPGNYIVKAYDHQGMPVFSRSLIKTR